VLIGVSGLVAEIGLFCHGNTEELMVKRSIFGKRTLDRIIVADYTKVGLQNGFRFGDAREFRANVNRCILVTDVPPADSPLEERERFSRQIQIMEERLGIKVERVGENK